MRVEDIKILNTWRDVADAARTTIRRAKGDKEVSSSWKMRMLMSEHSPIRKMFVCWKWVNLPYWVSVHFVRHKIGIEHFVSTQRSDRTGVNREVATQDAPVEHECIANFQTMINISRKRLCFKASQETREAWQGVLDEVKKVEPELVHCCVPDCVYRGRCKEFSTCGYDVTQHFKDSVEWYDNMKL
jgi:hypothetical protein